MERLQAEITELLAQADQIDAMLSQLQAGIAPPVEPPKDQEEESSPSPAQLDKLLDEASKLVAGIASAPSPDAPAPLPDSPPAPALPTTGRSSSPLALSRSPESLPPGHSLRSESAPPPEVVAEPLPPLEERILLTEQMEPLAEMIPGTAPEPAGAGVSLETEGAAPKTAQPPTDAPPESAVTTTAASEAPAAAPPPPATLLGETTPVPALAAFSMDPLPVLEADSNALAQVEDVTAAMAVQEAQAAASEAPATLPSDAGSVLAQPTLSTDLSPTVQTDSPASADLERRAIIAAAPEEALAAPPVVPTARHRDAAPETQPAATADSLPAAGPATPPAETAPLPAQPAPSMVAAAAGDSPASAQPGSVAALPAPATLQADVPSTLVQPPASAEQLAREAAQVPPVPVTPEKEVRPAPAMPEPVSASVAAPEKAATPLSREAQTALLRRAEEKLALGDIAAARALYRDAAQGGSSQAAAALGRTYQEDFLRGIGAVGVTADPLLAAVWARRAEALAATEPSPSAPSPQAPAEAPPRPAATAPPPAIAAPPQPPAPSEPAASPPPRATAAPPVIAPPPAASATPASPPRSGPAAPSEEMEGVIRRADAMIALRDISAARLLYAYAAQAGSGRAAAALGRTFDPAFLDEIGVQGIQPDPAQAVQWYRKAVALGEAQAAAALSRLERR